MATMSKAAFATIATRLAAACGRTPEELWMSECYIGLNEYPQAVVEAAARSLAKESGRKWVPTLGEWAEAVTEARRATAEAKLQSLPESSYDARYVCLACEDTGWEQFDPRTRKILVCPTDRCPKGPCQKPHTWTRACRCRESNVNYQRKHGAWKGAA